MVEDSFRGTVEQPCPLCGWFGLMRSFPTHWKTHGLITRIVWNIRKVLK